MLSILPYVVCNEIDTTEKDAIEIPRCIIPVHELDPQISETCK